jgi:hypothetical protein
LSGASIQGKSITFHTIENKARNIVPTLSPTLTNKIRGRILTQTGLAPRTDNNADYELSGQIVGYEVSVSGVENTQQASKNRLTISIDVQFINMLNPEADFENRFTRFADFPATQTLQAAENRLIEDIGNQLADDIFNKAFVNW